MEYYSAIEKELTINTHDHVIKSPNMASKEAFKKDTCCVALFTQRSRAQDLDLR